MESYADGLAWFLRYIPYIKKKKRKKTFKCLTVIALELRRLIIPNNQR